MARKKTRGRVLKTVKLDRTSSFNKFFICDHCGRREKTKIELLSHIKKCLTNRTCRWCNVVFKNRANLFSHSQMHGKEPIPNPKAKPLFRCTVCPKDYSLLKSLKNHIRQEHYNMKAKILAREKLEINQMWYEKVLNSDAIIQIKKCRHNVYLMRKAKGIDPSKIFESEELVDVTRLYPTRTSVRVWCNECERTYSKLGFRKHVNEKHMKIQKHFCNNCKRGFKRLYQYLQHNCASKAREKHKFPQLQASVVVQD